MWRQIPFLRILLFFVAGIIVQWHSDIPVDVAIVSLSIAILFLALSFIPRLKDQSGFLFGIGFGCLSFTLAVFATKATQNQAEWVADPGRCAYRAIVIDEPVDRPKTRMCKVRITAADEKIYSAAVGKKAIVYLPKDSRSQQLVAGDCLQLAGELKSSSARLKRQTIAAAGFIPENRWALQPDSKPAFSLRLKALAVRRAVLLPLRQVVPDPDSYSLAAALMFGYRNEIDSDLMQSFRNIGAAHILAISGTHFAILFGMIYLFLSLIIRNSPHGRILKYGILLPMAWAFAFLTGFSPSVVRAVTMLTLWSIGSVWVFGAFSLNTVSVTAFFMLLFYPPYLFDVGFQLSFLAVISIILLNPHLVRLYISRNPALHYCWRLTSVSISAQAGVLPLSIYYFHQFPVIFLLTNLCLLPLASVLLGLIPVTMLLHSLFSGVHWLSYPLRQLLDFFISIVQGLDRFSYVNIHNLHINEWDTFCLFLAILLLSLLLIKKRSFYLCLLLILIFFHRFPSI